jgi:transposase
MLQPVCRRTWAPRGQTPILRQWDRRDRLSAISALTLAPRRHVPHGFTLIWDRHRPHRATGVTRWLARHGRIVVEWLPAYAPDLNPVEPVWSHTKYADLANFAPDNLDTLEDAVFSSLADTRGQRALLAACVRAAGLEL